MDAAPGLNADRSARPLPVDETFCPDCGGYEIHLREAACGDESLAYWACDSCGFSWPARLELPETPESLWDSTNEAPSGVDDEETFP
jgi:hypothetical protein